MLQTKMKGNLSEWEEQYIIHSLSELKLNYIDEKKKPSDDEDSKKKKIDDSSSASADSKRKKNLPKKTKRAIID